MHYFLLFRAILTMMLLMLIVQDQEVSATWWYTYEWLAPSTDMMSPTIILKLVWMQMRSYVRLWPDV